MTKITVELIRDSYDFPAKAIAREGGNVLTVNFDRSHKMRLSGSRRSFKPELIEALKMVYPFSDVPRGILDGGIKVAADADVFGGGADTITNLYTVPHGKVLYILNCYLCTSNGGGVGGSPYGDIHIYDPPTGDTIEPLGHAWDFVGTDVQTSVSGEIQAGFPAGNIVRLLTGINTDQSGGFIGVIVDA